MIQNIEFEKLPGISKLFLDFINDKPEIISRFPNNDKLDDADYLLKRAENFDNRDILFNAFQSSMSYINFTEKQKENLLSIKEKNSLAIVSGQQVGFLGGPMYSLYKILTAIRTAENLNARHNNLNFIPVFWLEDNDHDIKEAAEISIINNQGDIKSFSSSEKSNQSERTIVSEKMFNHEIYTEIENIISQIPNSIHKEHFENVLRDTYKEGKYWRESFIILLQRWFGEFGVLFICASCLRKSGLFKDLVIKELENAGASEKLTLAANHELDLCGYHIQANASPVNLFYHNGIERFRIDITIDDRFMIGEKVVSKNELIEIASNQPELFSPKVLLRPIFQDAIIPTIAYIAGPGEIGYLAQTKEMFKFFDVEMPTVLPRHSFTLLSNKLEKFLAKNDIEIIDFYIDKQELINDYSKNMIGENTELLFKKSQDNLTRIFDELKIELKGIDNSLIQSADVALTKNLQQIDVLMKKTTASLKRQKDEVLKKISEISDYLYPKGILQERFFSPINFMIFSGEKELVELLFQATLKSPKIHHFIKI